jgi:hypothetical protein
MSFTDLFSEKADLYASARPRYPGSLFAYIASLAPSRDRAWDCGTGSGQAAISLGEHFSEVLASDPSRDQIDHAAAAANVQYSVQRAERTDFPSQHFDAICVAQALHWFDLESFFAEVDRLAKARAVFAAWGYSWPNIAPSFDTAFKATFRDIIEPYWAPQNQMLWNGYSDVPFPFPRLSTPEFQISVRWTFDQFISYVATWSATRKCIAETGTDFLADAESSLRPLWGDPAIAREISMPLCVWMGHIS